MRPQHEVIAADHATLDVGDRDAVMQAITTQPDAVVHCAAWTAVDACESDPDRAFRVNALGTRNVAEAARKRRRPPRVPVDRLRVRRRQARALRRVGRANPQSVYGRSKLGGEHRGARAAPRSCASRGCAASTAPTW